MYTSMGYSAQALEFMTAIFILLANDWAQEY